MKQPRLALLAAAGTALLALTGCAPTGDVAIEFGSTKITTKDVDLVTDFLCAYQASQSAADPNAAGAPAGAPLQQAQTSAAGIIAQSLVATKVADQKNVAADAAAVDQTLAQIQPTIDQVTSGKDRARLTQLLTDSVSSSSRFESAVQTAMAAEVGDRMQQLGQEEGQAIFDRLQRELVDAVVKGSDLEIDPVYGVNLDSTGYVDPSLSVPVSKFAQDSLQPQAPTEWLASLPASQRCG